MNLVSSELEGLRRLPAGERVVQAGRCRLITLKPYTLICLIDFWVL